MSESFGALGVASLQRELNSLRDDDYSTRLRALQALDTALVQTKPQLSQGKANLVVVQAVLDEVLKPLLKSASDPREKCRELALKIIKELLARCTDIVPFLPYVLSCIVDRLGAYDLEGIVDVPEVMRPNPSQKPQVLKSPPETSEEIRVLLATLVAEMVNMTPPEQFLPCLDELITVLRALAMDPAGAGVITQACQSISEICRSAPKLLLHYSEPLARSLFTALTHKQWKVRRAGLEALGQVFYTGVFKYNAFILEALTGFRDPNSVPIKDFYEPSTKLNYFAMLVADRSAHVREMFFRVVADLLISLPDKYDLESRLIPYLLSGLFDPIPEIRELTFEQIEEIGQVYEDEKEKDIREIRQFGYQDPWTADGVMVHLPLPEPFAKRPRLGARLYFRQYVRRYLNAIFAELLDWISASRERSASLLMALTIFTEDYMTQHIDQILAALYRCFTVSSDEVVISKLKVTTRLLGRYLDIKAYWPHVASTIKVR
jgi:hypothetical protein